MRVITVIVLIVLLSSCSLFMDTFEDVSAPYLQQYGQPEDEYVFETDDYCSIEWWWWSQGFMVNFVNILGNTKYGWDVDYEYNFSPI